MRVAVVLAALCLSAPALADTVVLVDGGRVQGDVREGPREVVVLTSVGTVRFPRREVKDILRAAGPEAEYARRLAALAYGDVAGHLALARWADRAGLPALAAERYHHVLRVDPTRDEAHRGLGRRRVDGVWQTPEQRRRAEGLVLYGGVWVPRDEARARHEALREGRRVREAREARQARAAREARRAAEIPASPPAQGAWGWGAGVLPVFGLGGRFPLTTPLFVWSGGLDRLGGLGFVGPGTGGLPAPPQVGLPGAPRAPVAPGAGAPNPANRPAPPSAPAPAPRPVGAVDATLPAPPPGG